MSIKNKYSLLIFLSIICFFFIIFFNLSGIAQFLVVNRPADKVDVIVVLSGGTGNRVFHASNLYQQGTSSTIVMTGSDDYFHKSVPDFMKEYAIFLGVDSNDIILEKNSYSTLDHMLNLRSFVSEYKWKRVMIVTSAFHTRRAYRVFKKGWHDLDIEIFVSPASDKIDYDNWYKYYEMSEKILMEWCRLILYYFRI